MDPAGVAIRAERRSREARAEWNRGEARAEWKRRPGASRRAEQARQLLDGLQGAAAHGLWLLTAERMLHDQKRQGGGAQGRHLARGEPLEDGGGDEPRGGAATGQLQRVVET